jgi:ribulose bisphosphate carboxylase small subunit
MYGGKRITTNKSYVRPQKTYQEKLSNMEIKEKLKDYKKVSDIRKVSIGTHLRYITIDPKTNNQLFRLGGNLIKFGTNGEYVTLSNGTLDWSVQIKNTTFFQKMTDDEIKEEMRNELKKEIMTEFSDEGKGSTIELKKKIRIY